MRELFLFKKVTTVAILFLTAIFAFGCGGSDGGGDGGGFAPTTADTETVFQLYPPNWGVNGYTERYSVSGTVKQNSEEAAISGTYEARIGDLTLPGVTFDTYSASVSIDIASQTGAISINGVIWYKSSTDEPVYLQETVSGTGMVPQTIKATPIDTSIPPPTAQIGDSGTSTSWSHDSWRISHQTWSLQSSTSGYALLISESSTYEGNTLVGSVYEEQKINESGERISVYQEIINYESNLTITVSGNITN